MSVNGAVRSYSRRFCLFAWCSCIDIVECKELYSAVEDAKYLNLKYLITNIRNV